MATAAYFPPITSSGAPFRASTTSDGFDGVAWVVTVGSERELLLLDGSHLLYIGCLPAVGENNKADIAGINQFGAFMCIALGKRTPIYQKQSRE
jgi:hypothetical protein